jgi:hypothetical protein
MWRLWECYESRQWRWYVDTAERMYELGVKAGLEPKAALEAAWDFVLKIKALEYEE